MAGSLLGGTAVKASRAQGSEQEYLDAFFALQLAQWEKPIAKADGPFRQPTKPTAGSDGSLLCNMVF